MTSGLKAWSTTGIIVKLSIRHLTRYHECPAAPMIYFNGLSGEIQTHYRLNRGQNPYCNSSFPVSWRSGRKYYYGMLRQTRSSCHNPQNALTVASVCHQVTFTQRTFWETIAVMCVGEVGTLLNTNTAYSQRTQQPKSVITLDADLTPYQYNIIYCLTHEWARYDANRLVNENVIKQHVFELLTELFLSSYSQTSLK